MAERPGPSGRRPGRVRLGPVVLLLACVSGAELPAQEPAGSGGPWLERTPYEIPFEDQDGWLGFMARGVDSAGVAALAAAYPEDEFAGLVDGSLATVKRVAFPSGPLRLRGLLVRPPGAGPFAAVVYARGGNREFGRLLFLDVVRMFTLARAGAVVLAPEYRGEGGSDGEPELASGDVDDLLAAVEALGDWADADTSRLGLVGLSRGGLVAAWALTRTPAFDAAVLVAPDLDLDDTARRRPAMDSAIYALSVPEYGEDPDALRAASPLHAVEKMAPTPILLLHGTADEAVHPSVSLRFSERLLDAGHRHRLLLLEGGTHALAAHALEVRGATVAWLARHVPMSPTTPRRRSP